MTESPGPLDGSSLRPVAGQGNMPFYPPSTPEHHCRAFDSPEGTYRLQQHIFFQSLSPLFAVGTTVSLCSIKYKESTFSQQRYDPPPPPEARSFRRMFSAMESNAAMAPMGLTPIESDDDASVRTASLSSSGASHTQAMTSPSATTLSDPIAAIPSTSTKPTLSESMPSTLFPTPSPSSLFSRNHAFRPQKAKEMIKGSKSSLVQRIVTNDQLAKILVARTSEDTNLFYNCGSHFVWMDASGRPKEPLSRVIFSKACPTSHDVNLLTRGVDHLDIIIGLTTGDVLWFDPLCNKHARINKDGVMKASAVTMIKWLPGSENLFMAAYQDGTVMLFDKDKEDKGLNADDDEGEGWYQAPTEKHTFRVTKPTAKAAARHNPVSHWKLSNKHITAFAFSPDCQHVAVVGLDGLLRIINFITEELCDIYESYYGGLLCVAWSPDGRYILAGGQDDLVTVWAFREQRIVARCQGHSSWVTGVAFDSWRCDERLYRFASVGEDARLILWDFSVHALHRPKARASTRHRGASVSSVSSFAAIQGPTARQAVVHPVPAKTEVAFLEPTVVKTVHADPCTGIYFREDVIVTSDKRGRVSLWQRPC